MHFGPREIAASVSAAALIFCCSCEKHHLGENPEAQKENIGEVEPGKESSAAEKKAENSESSTPKPTPAQFFPAEASPSP